MLAPRRIVVGVSCSKEPGDGVCVAPPDRQTFTAAAWLAHETGGSVHLVHVVDFMDERIAGAEEVLDEVREGLADELGRMCASVDVKTSIEVVRGQAWRELGRAAREVEADVILVSPRRELQVAARLIHGSTTHRLLRKAPCPVWVVDPTSPCQIGKVLALVDGSATSEVVAAHARDLCSVVGARLLLCHCLEYPEDVVLQRLSNAQKAISKHHRLERERMAAKLAKLGDGKAEVLLDEEWVVRAVPRLVAAHGIDLVVLAGGSPATLREALLGLTAERILERTRVSTWVVRPPE